MTESRWPEALTCVREGRVDALRRLLDDAPETIDARGDGGETLLHHAAERNDIAVAELLVTRGAALDAEASWGQNPFEWAANLGASGVAALLRDSGAGPVNLWTAAALGLAGEVERALSAGDPGRVSRPDADLSGWPEDTAFRQGDAISDALYIAGRNGHLEVVARLLERGADPGARGYFGATTLHWAAIGGHDGVVDLLLGAGADPNVRDPKFDADVAGWAREGGHDTLARNLETKAR